MLNQTRSTLHNRHRTPSLATIILCISLLFGQALMLPRSVAALTFLVTNTSSDPATAGSLPWAIEQARANPGFDDIQFDLPGGAALTFISPLLIDDTGGLLIDGYTNPGAAPNDSTTQCSNAITPIVIDGTNLISGASLMVLDGAQDVTIQGLAFVGGQPDQTAIQLLNAQNINIWGNSIGAPDGISPPPGNLLGNGIVLEDGTASTLIGTDGDGSNDLQERNIIIGVTGTPGNGMLFDGTINPVSSNTVAGNCIGINNNNNPRPNITGVRVATSASDNVIGTNDDNVGDAAERNIISGNDQGVVLSGSAVQNNRVAGNAIGVGFNGASRITNQTGVRLEGGANNNLIGVNGDGSHDTLDRNIISGNSVHGVLLTGAGTSNNTVAGNYIGPQQNGINIPTTGTNPVGVQVENGAANNLIGSDADGVGDTAESNTISGNANTGILLTGSTTTNNRVSGNFIGLDRLGQTSLANGGDGILLTAGTNNNLIGYSFSAPAGLGNFISGNTNNGIELTGGARNNTIAGNTIGVSRPPVTAIRNQTGILLQGGARDNLIGTNADGTTDDSEGNTIAAHDQSEGAGVRINGATTLNNRLFGNNIGLPTFGNAIGVRLEDQTQGNLIGGALAPQRNDILNNGVGVESFNTETVGGGTPNGDGPGDNQIINNLIETSSRSGIRNVGSSPIIQGNTIQNNNGSGIVNEVFFGADSSPASSNDDLLARPLIGGSNAGEPNTITNNCAAPGGSDCAGIFSLDTQPDNGGINATNQAFLSQQNTTGAQNGNNRVDQRWYGAVEITVGSAVVARSTILTSSSGLPIYTMDQTAQCVGGLLNDTIIHTDRAPVDCADVTTWSIVQDYAVGPGGALQQFNGYSTPLPDQDTYSFDGDAATDPTDTGAGFAAEGILTVPLLRYQVMELSIDPIVTIDTSGLITTLDEADPTITGSFTVVLGKLPAGTVQLQLNFNPNQVTLNGSSISPLVLNFSTTTWLNPQTVTVAAVDDPVVEASPHSTNITYTFIGGGYAGLTGTATTTVNINDNDPAELILTETGGSTNVAEGGASDSYTVALRSQPTTNITVDLAPDAAVNVAPTQLTFTPTDWNSPQPVTVAAVDDQIDTDGTTANINHTATGGSYTGVAAALPVAVTDNDTAGLVVTPTSLNVTEGGAAGTYTVALATEPTATVAVAVQFPNTVTVNGSSTPVTLTFTPANWNIPQPVSVVAVDNIQTDGQRTITITHQSTSSDAKYAGLSGSPVSVIITDNDTPGVTITPIVLSLREGQSDSYTVVLTTQPTAAVNLTANFDPQQIAVSPAVLTFTPTNWDTPQTVTVTSIDDGAGENLHATTIGYTVSSSDLGYNDLSTVDVTINLTDFVTGSTVVYLPRIIPALTPLPDLIGALTISPAKSTFQVNDLVEITATITNVGLVANERTFWVDLLINPKSPPTPEDLPLTWNQKCTLAPCYGIAWLVTSSIPPGQSITLTATADSYFVEQTVWPGTFASGTTSLYLYIDTWNSQGLPGNQQELNETNNSSDVNGLQVLGTDPADPVGLLLQDQGPNLPPRLTLSLQQRRASNE